MAPTQKTNFKTYEASTRLLAAVIATNKVKLDFKELAAHVGGGATKDSINHRLRPIKQLAKMQAACVKEGKDPGDLPIEKGEIQKLFGESTPGGIEWQFRDIKALGRAQKDAVAKGENPARVTVPGTPSSSRSVNVASTPGSRASKLSLSTTSAASTPTSRASTQKRKRSQPASFRDGEGDDDDDAADLDDSELDARDLEQDTPTKRPAPKKSRPAHLGQTQASPITTTPTTTAPPRPAAADLGMGGGGGGSSSIFGSGNMGISSSFAGSSFAASDSAMTSSFSNPFHIRDDEDDEGDALSVIDVSQVPKPKTKVKQEYAPLQRQPRRDDVPPQQQQFEMHYADPLAGILPEEYEDGEI